MHILQTEIHVASVLALRAASMASGSLSSLHSTYKRDYKGGHVIYKGGRSIYKGGRIIYKGGRRDYKGGRKDYRRLITIGHGEVQGAVR